MTGDDDARAMAMEMAQALALLGPDMPSTPTFSIR